MEMLAEILEERGGFWLLEPRGFGIYLGVTD